MRSYNFVAACRAKITPQGMNAICAEIIAPPLLIVESTLPNVASIETPLKFMFAPSLV